jgi:hypothetical protein
MWKDTEQARVAALQSAYAWYVNSPVTASPSSGHPRLHTKNKTPRPRLDISLPPYVSYSRGRAPGRFHFYPVHNRKKSCDYVAKPTHLPPAHLQSHSRPHSKSPHIYDIGEQYRSFSSSCRSRRARRHSAISIMQAQADWRRQACGQESGGGSKGARPPPTRCRSAQGAQGPRRDGGRPLLGVCARGKKRCVG